MWVVVVGQRTSTSTSEWDIARRAHSPDGWQRQGGPSSRGSTSAAARVAQLGEPMQDVVHRTARHAAVHQAVEQLGLLGAKLAADGADIVHAGLDTAFSGARLGYERSWAGLPADSVRPSNPVGDQHRMPHCADSERSRVTMLHPSFSGLP